MLHNADGRPTGVTFGNAIDLFLHLVRDHGVEFSIGELELPREESFALWLDTHLDRHDQKVQAHRSSSWTP
jgi:hypothetical protein